MISYPLLVLLFFLSCGLVRLQSISLIVKIMWRVWALSVAFFAIILRLNRANLNGRVAWTVMQNHVVHLFVVTVAMFLIVFFCVEKYLRVTHHARKNSTLPTHAHVLVSREELIIVVALLNECVIIVMQILMNATFFNWVDVIVVPISRMAVVQMLIFVCIAIDTTIHRKKRKINTAMVCIGYGLLLVASVLMNAVVLVLVTQYRMFSGMILLGVSVLIGWGVVIYLYCNRKFDSEDKLIRLYKY